MDKRRSVKKLFRRSSWAVVVLLASATCAYGIYSVHAYARQLLDHSLTTLEKYTATLSEDLDMLKEFNHNMVYANPSFQLLTLNNYADSKRVVEQYNLRQIMLSHTPTYGVTMLYDHAQDTAYYVQGNRVSRDQVRNNELNGYLHQLGKEPEGFGFEKYDAWFASSDGYDPYMVLMNNHGRATLLSLFNIRAYLERSPVPNYTDESSVIIFSSKDILVGGDVAERHGIDTDTLLRSVQRDGAVSVPGFILHTVQLEGYGIGVCVVTPFSTLVTHVVPQLAFLAFVVLLAAGVIFVFYRALSGVLVLPLQEIGVMSQQLRDKEGQREEVQPPSVNFEEFEVIKNALADLRDDITALEMEKHEKESQREHALLQYFQLQTRSHFFLNCLKSLYSMLENGEHGRMKSMILGFSNHLRYIFQDNLSVVTLESELKEVNDYHRILLLDSSRILLLRQEVPPDLLACKVPPLIIQTFLENAYKYNERTGVPLSFHIQVSRVDYNGGEYLQIHCSDNGCGYSPQVLERINHEPCGVFDQLNVGINNLRRRMSIVYKGDFHTIFYNLPTGGACSVIFVSILK